MEFQAILDTIKEKISSLFSKIHDFYEENRTLSYIIAALFSLIIVCIILLIIALGKKKEPVEIPGTVLELTETPLVPAGPELPKDYTSSRSVKDKWTEEEGKEWFTLPTQKEIDSLAKSNDLLINEITGAAP